MGEEGGRRQTWRLLRAGKKTVDMTAWGNVVLVSIPIPIALLALLIIPLPSSFRKRVFALVDGVLYLKILNGVPLVLFMTSCSFLAFAVTSADTLRVHSSRPDNFAALSPNQQISFRASKWRSERNWWISFTCLFTWIILQRMHTLLRAHHNMSVKVKEDDAPSETPAPDKKGK